MNRLDIRSWFVSLCAACVVASLPVFAGVFGKHPDILVCSIDDTISSQPWDRLVFYVSARLKDGGIIYKTMTSNPVLVTITPNGIVDARNLMDCNGKTVQELREAGRAFDF